MVSGDMIEALGVERARAAMRQAQVIFYLLDASAPDLAGEILEFERNKPSNIQHLIAVWNKMDLAGNRPLPELSGCETVKISVQTGENLEDLLDVFERTVWSDAGGTADTPTAVNARHLALLQNARAALESVAAEITSGNWELAAVNLHLALQETGKIIGETVEPDLLDEIFSRFCIGK